MTDTRNKDISIIQFDPDDFYITFIDLLLDNWNTKLSGYAYNLESSIELIKKIEGKRIKPDVAIIEAHMGKSEFDGQKIAERLRSLVPDIKIIGFSTYETNQWADIEAIKSLKDTKATIISAISEVTGVEYEISNVKDPSD